MKTTIHAICEQLWADDLGGLVTTEYLTLGTVLVLGGIGGLSAMSRAMNEEMAEYGQTVSSINQSYRQAVPRNDVSAKAGAEVYDRTGDLNCCP